MSRGMRWVWTAAWCLFVIGEAFGQVQKPAGGRSTSVAQPVDPDTPGSNSTIKADPTAVVPRLMKFSGVLRDMAGKPLTRTVDVTFSLYSTEVGGLPLWFETQSVQAEELGRYTALLVSVPYALKAGDAETLGGKPASASPIARHKNVDPKEIAHLGH